MNDILLHLLGAAALVLIGLFVPADYGIAFLNMCFWMGREWEQEANRSWPWHWSTQKTLEWAVPTVWGFIIVIFYNMVMPEWW